MLNLKYYYICNNDWFRITNSLGIYILSTGLVNKIATVQEKLKEGMYHSRLCIYYLFIFFPSKWPSSTDDVRVVFVDIFFI